MTSLFSAGRSKFFDDPIPGMGLFAKRKPKKRAAPKKGIDILRFFAVASAAILLSLAVDVNTSVKYGDLTSGGRISEIVDVSANSTELPVVLGSNTTQTILRLDGFPVGEGLADSNFSRTFFSPSNTDAFEGVVSAEGYLEDRQYGDLQDNTLAVLDENERIRIEAFRQLNDGWDFGSGRHLSGKSLRAFDRFFALGDFSPSDLAIFMSSEGNLVASWSSIQGSAELEFSPTHFVYIDDSLDDSRIVSLHSAGDFRRSLARNISRESIEV